jgi:hypothetical protein
VAALEGLRLARDLNAISFEANDGRETRALRTHSLNSRSRSIRPITILTNTAKRATLLVSAYAEK